MAPERLLALGDSYTIGEGVAVADAWPRQLQRALSDRGRPDLGVEILATTGWTCADLAAAMDAATLTPPYTLVSLGIGVNNQYRGDDVGSYRAPFCALLQRAIALAGERADHVLVLSIPDWSVTRFAREQGRDDAAESAIIDAWNACAHEAVGASGARWVDVTGLSRDCASWLADDGLHPSPAQYQRWLTPIRVAANAALGND